MKNLEFKAYYSNKRAHSISKKITDDIHILNQTDIYFNVSSGRLKLRKIITKYNTVSWELIHYYRPDQTSAKDSNYQICKVIDGNALLDILTHIHGILVIVNKQRTVYLYKNARIHIDCVEGLGEFLEFEVVYPCTVEINEDNHVGVQAELRSVEDNSVKKLMEKLQKRFCVDKYAKLCSHSYSDMLLHIQNESNVN